MTLWHSPTMNETKLTVSGVIRSHLKQQREDRGWTQTQLGKILKEQTGEDWSQIRVLDLEGGRRRDRKITADELAVVTQIFDKPLRYFLVIPDDAEVEIDGHIYRGVDLVYLLGVEGHDDAYFSWQRHMFMKATVRLVADRRFNDDILRDAEEGFETTDDDGEILWGGPSPEETAEAQRQLRELYREALGSVRYEAIIEDKNFWEKVRADYPRWGTSSADDSFTNHVLRTLKS